MGGPHSWSHKSLVSLQWTPVLSPPPRGKKKRIAGLFFSVPTSSVTPRRQQRRRIMTYLALSGKGNDVDGQHMGLRFSEVFFLAFFFFFVVPPNNTFFSMFSALVFLFASK